MNKYTRQPNILIIFHTPSKNTNMMRDALVRGASHKNYDVIINSLTPFEASASDVMDADAIILGTTENFGYMSGAMKDFFDRIYYPCLENTQAKPFSLIIRAGIDGTGTKTAVNKIVSGLKWKLVQPVLICKGDYNKRFLAECEELGLIMCASVDTNII